jgi:hypothetical protein
MLVCLKCGNEWEPKKENPKRCPQCKTTAWMTPPGIGYRAPDTTTPVTTPVTPTTNNGHRELENTLTARNADIDRLERKLVRLHDEVERIKKQLQLI